MGMDDDKGKGRASNLDDGDKPPIEGSPLYSSSSLLERVTASATGLAQSAFAAPTNNELSDAASGALTSTGKGRQLDRSSGSWAESSHANQPSGLPITTGQSLPTIRSGHREEHIRDVEDEFSSFLEGIDSFTPSSELRQTTPSRGHEVDKPLERAHGSTDTHRNQAGEVLYNTVDEQQRHDGDAVLSILSHSSVTSDELDSLPVEDEVINWGLTDQQISRLRALMDEIFPWPDQHVQISVEHPLNLVPNMVSNPATSDPALSMGTSLEESYMYFGDVPQNKARQVWMEQWEGVLTGYTDEVWGNLLPLVVEAREEVKVIKDDPGTNLEQLKALRRLRLVLDHVRKL